MKTVVITGASKGLGRAMALRFADEGWRVCGCGRDKTALAELQDTLGGDHLLQVCDVTADLSDALSNVLAQFLARDRSCPCARQCA